LPEPLFVWILQAIDALATRTLRDIFRLVLSDQLRDVSLQDPGDLRIRRRKHNPSNHPLLALFADSLTRRVEQVVVAKSKLGTHTTTQRAIVADSRDKHALDSGTFVRARPNAVISSPPYATALPYIDTQRLSLCVLGLVDWRDIGKLDRSLIGTREMGSNERARIEERIARPPDHLRAVGRRCRDLLEGLSSTDGFRRRNGPALMYQYFEGMAQVLCNLLIHVERGGQAAFVVGPNATTLGGSTYVIDTPQLLLGVADRLGWRVEDSIPLDTYQRFDLHTRNSIRSESLLWLRAPAHAVAGH